MSPTFTLPAGITTRDRPVPDDLYQRYQAAHRAYQVHVASCDGCTRDTPNCPAGRRLFESFARLQDAYLAKQKQRRG
ncbi:hypothetical protein [Streptomyces sp. NRRL F-3307]|uniref:hypothetical protein n=1 Tax=Streptomyces sp. NRRL F-3307 TaxID=1463849 RepID=UPI000AFE1510|nr:hypothetical protein [Streptomyces sp. NRRL F-3307]